VFGVVGEVTGAYSSVGAPVVEGAVDVVAGCGVVTAVTGAVVGAAVGGAVGASVVGATVATAVVGTVVVDNGAAVFVVWVVSVELLAPLSLSLEQPATIASAVSEASRPRRREVVFIARPCYAGVRDAAAARR